MSSYEGIDKNDLYSARNTDDIFNRVVIVGLLDLMNKRIRYKQVYDNSVVETVEVPCMYDFGSSDERFAQDNYAFFGNECFNAHMITGKFDMLPRCIIRYIGSQIDSSSITNRFVKGKYIVNDGGRLVTYSTYLYSIPVTMNFECSVYCDGVNSAFKIEQNIRETFYKNRTFRVLYRGNVISCCAGFPESITDNRTVNYNFDNEREIHLNFSIAVEAYQPVFDESVKIDADNRIENIVFDVTDFPLSEKKTKRECFLKFKEVDTSSVYPSGGRILLSWDSGSNVSDMLSVSLSYSCNGGEYELINGCIDNNYSYVWMIPEGISGYSSPNVNIVCPDDIRCIESAEVFIVPSSDGSVNEESFRILYGGVYLYSGRTAFVPVIMDYVGTDGKMRVSSDGYYAVMEGSKVVSFKCPDVGSSVFVYDKPFEPVKISVKISYPLMDDVYDVIDNILVL